MGATVRLVRRRGALNKEIELMKQTTTMTPKMKKLVVREVETLKTTAAFYTCGCAGQLPCWPWEN